MHLQNEIYLFICQFICQPQSQPQPLNLVLTWVRYQNCCVKQTQFNPVLGRLSLTQCSQSQVYKYQPININRTNMQNISMIVSFSIIPSILVVASEYYSITLSNNPTQRVERNIQSYVAHRDNKQTDDWLLQYNE